MIQIYDDYRGFVWMYRLLPATYNNMQQKIALFRREIRNREVENYRTARRKQLLLIQPHIGSPLQQHSATNENFNRTMLLNYSFTELISVIQQKASIGKLEALQQLLYYLYSVELPVHEKQAALDILSSIHSEVDRLHDQQMEFFQSEALNQAEFLHKTIIHFILDRLKSGPRGDTITDCSWMHDQLLLWVESLTRLLKTIHETVRSENQQRDLKLLCLLNRLQSQCQVLLSFIIVLIDSIIIESQKKKEQFLRLIPEQMITLLTEVLVIGDLGVQLKIIVSEILLVLSSLKIEEYFNAILQGRFINTIKMYIIFSEEFKKPSRPPFTASRSLEMNLFDNFIRLLLQMGKNNCSDQFWISGLAQEIKMTINDIPEGRARKDLTTLIFDFVVNISELNSVWLINEAEIFDWTLDLIKKWLDTEVMEDELIQSALSLLKFFIEIGQCELSDNPKLTQNPYKLKFKYSRGDEIFNRFQAGINFLSDNNIDCDNFL